MKKCSKCKKNKQLNEFGKDKTSKDGFKYQCKQCVNNFARNRSRKKTFFTCESCKITKEVDFYSGKKRKTNLCLNCFSKQTQTGIKRPQFSKENSGRWNGGEYISTDGYKMIKCENKFHPSGRTKYKREHVLIVENHIGRELNTQRGYMGEQIHHIDGNKLNNDISNLLLCNNTKEHKIIDCQLHELAFELVRQGVILFDKQNKKYYIDKDRINASNT